ncbi:MAG TPA: PAS domain S-box protein, partial [Vicinamibacteria bacterium]|nr:PAS domain S-box protein [Vicinamibacteria bacterium]
MRSTLRPTLPLVALFLLGSAALWAYLAFDYLPSERMVTIDRWRRELSSQAELTAEVIVSWVGEGLADARTLAAYPAVRDRLTRPGTASGHGASHLGEILDALAANRGHLAVFVADAGGRVVARSHGGFELGTCCAEAVRQVTAHGTPAVRMAQGEGGRPLVVFAAPVRGGEAAQGPIRGAAGAVVDPDRFLYRFLTARPSPGSSGEALLVRREGDEVVFLSPLRHDPSPPLTVRRRVETPALPASAAVQGGAGFGEMVDYRGEPVFAAYRRLGSAGWGLVVKVDRAEALGPLRESARRVAAGLGSALGMLLVTAAGLLWAQRRAHRAALALSQARFALLLEQANDAILFLSRDGRIRDVNPRAEEMYGRSRGELLGLSVADLWPPEGRDEALRNHEAVLAEGRRTFETQHRRADGAAFAVEVSASRVQLEGETAVLGLVRDVSGRKLAEERVRRAHEFAAAVTQSSPVGVLATDREGRITFANRRAEELLGVSADEMRGRFYDDPARRATGHDGEPLSPGELAFARVKAARSLVQDVRQAIERDDGRPVLLSVNGAPLLDRDGGFAGAVFSLEDVTGRVRVERAFAGSEERFRALFEHAGIGVALLDTGGRVLHANPALAAFLGYRREELQRLSVEDVSHPEDLATDRATW